MGKLLETLLTPLRDLIARLVSSLWNSVIQPNITSLSTAQTETTLDRMPRIILALLITGWLVDLVLNLYIRKAPAPEPNRRKPRALSDAEGARELGVKQAPSLTAETSKKTGVFPKTNAPTKAGAPESARAKANAPEKAVPSPQANAPKKAITPLLGDVREQRLDTTPSFMYLTPTARRIPGNARTLRRMRRKLHAGNPPTPHIASAAKRYRYVPTKKGGDTPSPE